MCFPSKWLKKNFVEEETPKASGSKPTKETERPPNAPADQPVTNDVGVATREHPAKTFKIAIVIYTVFGHISAIAESIKVGVESAGGSATIYQVPETLSEEILRKVHAPPKPDYPVITPDVLATYDAFMLGIPTKFGNYPAQWKAFWDSTGSLWTSGALAGKYAGIFVSTSDPGGGQESTVYNALSVLTHHGIIFVPLGYKHAFSQLTSLEEVHGGSPWGSGTVSGAENLRKPSALEHEIARIHGKSFGDYLSRITL